MTAPPSAFGYGVNDCVGITDDFGQEASIYPSRIHGVMLEDLNLSKDAHIARGLHTARTQMEFEKTARADPGMRPHGSPGGPSIIQPFPMNGGRPPQ